MHLDICPFVRFSRVQQNYPKGDNIGLDHRLFYCLSGSGVIRINNIDYNITQGAVLFWRAGTVYSYIPNEKDPFEFIGINFDFNNPDFENATPIPPATIEKFSLDNIVESVFTVEEIFNDTVFIKNGFMLRSIFENINREFTQKRLYYNDYCSVEMVKLIIELYRYIKTNNLKSNVALVDSVLNYIERHLQDDLSNSNIGYHFGYHANYINRLIVNSTGKSLHRYVIECRINKAIELLHDTELSVGDISELVGFYDIAGFSKTFRKIVGVSPSEFQKSAHVKQ